MKNKDLLVIIDCGHGGINSKGDYTTKGKQFKFPDGVVAYEGFYNRIIGRKLNDVLVKEDIKCAYTVNPCDSTDIPLGTRVRIEHKYNFEGYTTFFVSLHSNAGGGNGRGFEIFTSVGQTKSDALATAIGEEIKREFPDMKFRADTSDGDIDKESPFYVLKKTVGMSVLLENLFFDNREDFELLRSESFQDRLVCAIAQGIIDHSKKC